MRFPFASSTASSVRHVALLLIALVGMAPAARPAAAQVDVQVRDVSGTVGESLAVPVTVSGLNGKKVTAYEFALPFDPSVVEVTGVSTQGTITPSAPTVNVTADTLKVSFSAAEPLEADSGVLLEIEAQLVGAGRAVLGFQSFRLFNRDGREVASTTDSGIVTDAPLVEVQVPDVRGRAGDDVALSLGVDGLDGRRVTAYEFALPFDSSVVDLTGVSIDSTVTPSAPTVNVEDGELRVAFSAAEPLEGEGPLLTLEGTLSGDGTDRLAFRSLEFFNRDGLEVASGSRAGRVQSAPRLTGRIPDTTAQVGQTGTVPIRIDGLEGADVTAYEFTLPYDSSVVDVTGVSTTGTVTPSAPTVNVTGEELRVSFSSAEALSGEGPLLRLQTRYAGAGSAVLDPRDVQFFDSNAARVSAALASGIVTVEGATDGLRVRVPDVEGDAGQAVTIPLRTDSLDGQNVTAYQFTLPFDPSVVDVTGVAVEGTVTPSPPITNLSDDTLKVSFSAAEPLTGPGPLLKLRARLTSGGEDVLDFSNIQFFDGGTEVPATSVPGRVTVQAPSAVSSTTVRDDGTVEFEGTGASITFSGVSGTGTVTVRRFGTPPTAPTGIGAPDVSGSRYVISASGDLSIGAGTAARFDVTTLDSLPNPATATVYRRDSVGRGSFAPLPTQFDAATDEIVAALPSFSEFAVASDGTPPDVPENLVAAPAPDSVSLAWTGSDAADVDRYRIYRDTTAIDSAGGPSDRTLLDSTQAGSTTVVDTGVTAGQQYYYRVTAVDTAANESGFSNQARATPTEVTPPAITVTPRSVSDTLALGDSSRQAIQIRNTASGETAADLTYEVIVGPQRSGSVEWVTATPTTGRVAPGDSQAVSVRATAGGTPPGTYEATIRVSSNDPDQTTTDVSAALTIERPPLSLANPAELPAPGTGATVELDVPPSITPLSATFFYRPAGARTFRDTTRSLGGVEAGGTATFAIPGGAVTNTGVQYYVRLRGLLPSGRDSLQLTVPATAPAQTAFLPAQTGEATAKGAFEAATYRMLTIPFALGDRSVFDVLTGEYGSPDPAVWRVARWNPDESTYQFGESAVSGMAPGDAFWLITEEGDTLTVEESGRSVDASGPRTVSLQSGWNQIGSPFLFPVAWSDVDPPAPVRPPVTYDASRSQGDRYRFAADTLRPWRGAFVYNEADTSVSLEIPPIEATGGDGASAGVSLAKAAAATDAYRLQATAVHHRPGRTLNDPATWLGFDETAEPGFGPKDRAKPPAVGPHVRLHVRPEDGPALARSLKPLASDGAVWDLRVGLHLGEPLRSPKTVTIVLHEQGERPSGFRRYVVDRDRKRRLPVTHQSVTVRLTPDQPTRRLRVIVGTEAFARRHNAGAALTVEKTKLRANAPNPFTESTTIPYQLAEKTDVTIAIYDLLGRRVRTLVDGPRQAGVHQVTWRPGRGEEALASGVYFCRMKAGSYRATRKITLVR